ncbi:hypothetical protein V8E54_011658 [Elaphomyces granulatus]
MSADSDGLGCGTDPLSLSASRQCSGPSSTVQRLSIPKNLSPLSLQFNTSNQPFLQVIGDLRMDGIGLQWCSKCTTFRDAQSFEKHKSGKVKKLCNRHGEKRDLDAIFDDWADFEAQLHPIRITGIELYAQFG